MLGEVLAHISASDWPSMSFGFGVGDIIGVSTLAWKVFKACKESSDEFKSLSSEVVSLHVVLKETEELVAETGPSLRADQEPQLRHITDGCQKVLEDVEGLLKKYESLGTKSQRTWDRMKWGAEGVANVRTRLISNTSMLSAYNSTIVKWASPIQGLSATRNSLTVHATAHRWPGSNGN